MRKNRAANVACGRSADRLEPGLRFITLSPLVLLKSETLMVNLLKTTCCLGFLLTMMSGCASLTGMFGNDIRFASPQQPAVEVICLWEPSEGKTPDGKPARGFEGTLLFFDSSRTSPVGVHGEVTITVHDDYGPRESWDEPVSEFTFSSEEWDQFLTQSTFGPSYRIFIPYMRKQPYQVNTSISVKFTSATSGRNFQSRTSQVVIPGPIRESVQPSLEAQASLRERSPEQLKQYVAEALTPETRTPRIDTIHSWNPAGSSSGGQIQLSRYQVTHGKPTGEVSQLSESASGADAESWGSTPPAHFTTPGSDDIEQVEQPRRRFKLSR